MSVFTFSIVLLAAALHAVWNALVKAAADRAVVLGMISFGHVILGVGMAVMAPLPAMESWGFIVGSTLIHWGYYFFLYHSYRLGDLSQVYPIARGIAPVLVALGAQGFAGEVLPAQAWAGILMVSGGIGLLFMVPKAKQTRPIAVASALAVGATIAAYSVADGMGVRLAESRFGYIGWLFLLECIAAFWFMGYRRKVLRMVTLKTWAIGILGGLISAAAYGLAIFAKSLTTLGTVSAIRESSVIIAALIGVIWFHERPWKIRVAAGAVVAVGVIVLATAR